MVFMVMSQNDLVEQYALAAFETALEAWQKPLQSVVQALEANAETAAKLATPGEPIESRRRILDGLIPPDAPAPVRAFLHLLLQEGQFDRLPAILKGFGRLCRREERAAVARVVSAVALTEPERATLEERLRSRFGAAVRPTYNVDPAIIGGLFIQVGDVVIDGTVAGKLDKLRAELAGV
jgi:F-type H+-transporting ATPase subunit delta